MIKALVDLIKENEKDGMIVAEIGVWVGETTKHYLPTIAANNGKVYIVDWFCGNQDITNIPNHIHRYNPENSDSIFKQFLENTDEYLDYMCILRGNSIDMVSSIPDESLDICFIDAGHIYSEITKDIANYLPKVKKNGILCGHDCEDISLANTFSPDVVLLHYWNGVHPGVIQAVYDAFGTNIEIRNDDNGDKIPIWIYKKL